MGPVGFYRVDENSRQSGFEANKTIIRASSEKNDASGR